MMTKSLAVKLEIDPARAERRSAMLRFFANPPRKIVEAAPALREADELYGDDGDRELADIEAGRHPLQRAKGKSSPG